MATRSRIGSGNVGSTGFTVRVVGGLILLAIPMFRFIVGFWAGVFVTAGIVALLSAFTRTCPATAAWNMWFRGGGSSPAPKRLTGGGPEPGQGSSERSSGGGHSQSGPEKRDAPGPESFSGSGKQGGDSDKDR
ncbi:MAG: YgaP family membrane protein [Bacillota bacterium]